MKIIETVMQTVKKRCLVIAGTGANSTSEAMDLTSEAAKMGIDATLQVTPYYNKPSQEGLYRHFSIVADEIGVPVVLYNVPGRSGVPIEVNTVKRLANNPNIVAVKEAGGSVERVSAILDLCDIDVVSGDDALALPMMSVGAKGVISVASNIIPSAVRDLVHSYLNGNLSGALGIHKKYYKLFKAFFIETNPIPIKAAMAEKNIIEEQYRLPLCHMNPKNREKLVDTMKACGII
jgi:4-hydroxy-tetrahydrodipicolinate synthase